MEQVDAAFERTGNYDEWAARERALKLARCPIDKELRVLGACHIGRYWCGKAGVKTVEDIWQKCPRADWMAWLLCGTVGNDARWVTHTYAHVLARCLQLNLLPPSDEDVMSALGDLEACREPVWGGGDSNMGKDYIDTLMYSVAQLVEAYRAFKASMGWYAFDTFHQGGEALEAAFSPAGRAFLMGASDIMREVISLKDVQEAWDSKMKSMGFLK